MLPSTSLWSVCTDFYFARRLELRSQKTKDSYRFALDNFGRHLGRVPTLADLDDDLVTVWVGAQLDQPGSVYSVRERLGRILALWRFLAARRIVDRWPTVKRPPAPDPMPIALTRDELRALFESAMYEPGKIGGVRAGWWWQGYLSFVWSTAERRSAALALKWEHCDLSAAVAVIPPEFRKGKRKAGIYRLWPEVVTLIERMKMPPREMVFPWPYSEGRYYHNFGRIAERANLPNDAAHKTHALRVSHASWLAMLGGNASIALGHSDPATTTRHYIDPKIYMPDQPKLFIPWEHPAG